MSYADLILVIPFFTGVVFLISGAIMYLFPPKKPNMFYGYRTSKSMSSQEIWDFSQKYASQKMLFLGFIFLLFSSIGIWINFSSKTENIVSFVLIGIGVIYLLISVETAINSKFPNQKS